MPTTPPAVSTLPPAPVRGQPGFSAATGTFLEALPDWGDELQAAGEATHANAVEVAETALELEGIVSVAADAAGLFGKSNSTLTVVAGVKVVHLLAPKPDFALDDEVVLILRSDSTIRMFGSITAWDGVDDMEVTVVSGGVYGSGGYGSWFVSHAAFMVGGATAEDYWVGTTDAAASTPKGLREAVAFGLLTDAAEVEWPVEEQGIHVRLTLTANGHKVGAPSIQDSGVTYVLNLNPATFTLAADAAGWDAKINFGAAGYPTFPANAWSKITMQYDEVADEFQAGVWRGA